MNLYYKLSILMGIVVVSSNFLVQFPVQYFGLSEVLTYGAFSYPITFLITDLANRAYGKVVARKVVYIGFIIGILLTLVVSTNFNDIISIRIAIGSGLAFFLAQNVVSYSFQFCVALSNFPLEKPGGRSMVALKQAIGVLGFV